MKSAKYLMFVFAFLAVAMFASSASAMNATINYVELDHSTLNPTSTNAIYSIERDQSVEVTVQFTSHETTTVLKNVQVEARIRGYDQNDIIGDVSDAFDVMPGVTYTKDLTLKLPIRLDQQQYKLRVSVADADPATIMRGRPGIDLTRSAGTSMTAAAPSPIGEASSRLMGVATMADFSNCSRVMRSCKRANGLCTAFACALIEKGAKSACFQPYSYM